MELDKLKQIIAEVLSVDTREIVGNTTFLGDLGADSLDVYQIVLKVEETFSIHMNPIEIERIRTVDEALNLIKKAEQKARGLT